jgi:hypothetical protein
VHSRPRTRPESTLESSKHASRTFFQPPNCIFEPTSLQLLIWSKHSSRPTSIQIIQTRLEKLLPASQQYLWTTSLHQPDL